MGIKILLVDDEPAALNVLERTVRQVKPDCEISKFEDPYGVLEKVYDEGYRPDVAFLDIEMYYDLTGLGLAKKIKDQSPQTEIIFVTGYSEYALEAYSVHARGYLLKPVTADQIQEEFDNLNLPWETENGKPLRVRCFGTFEVFYDNQPLHFSRRQTKELLAFLIDRKGAFCNHKEIMAALWEEKADTPSLHSQLRNLIADLTLTLRKLDLANVLTKERGQLAINTQALDCDYYRFLAGDALAVNSYRGEYMSQYSWAEMTLAALSRS